MTCVLHHLLLIWLFVCAIYDYRSREVPNLLTLPPFVVGILWAALQGRYVLYLTLFTLCITLYLWKTNRLGGADSKVLVVLASLWQVGLVGATAGMVIRAFYQRMEPHPALPGVFMGVLLVSFFVQC
jgi:Flp pilus assembly protein protease CpaA